MQGDGGGMQGLRLLFSPSGRLSPRSFIVAVVLLYMAAAASQTLTLPGVIKSAGLWPFLAAQIVLVWIWYALHAKRLRDAGKPAGLAVAVSVLYVLSVALLVIIAGAFYGALAGQGGDANAAGALGLILFVSIIAMLSGAPNDNLAWLIVAILLLIAYLPMLLAVVTTAWAATRPSAQRPAA
jgi:uncharacterized membrane protein YhaH (DUF805 family)